MPRTVAACLAVPDLKLVVSYFEILNERVCVSCMCGLTHSSGLGQGPARPKLHRAAGTTGLVLYSVVECETVFIPNNCEFLRSSHVALRLPQTQENRQQRLYRAHRMCGLSQRTFNMSASGLTDYSVESAALRADSRDWGASPHPWSDRDSGRDSRTV